MRESHNYLTSVTLLYRLATQLHISDAMSTPGLAFDDWKLRLWKDCERQGKSLVFSNLGEDCLKVLWEAGTDPSVQGVIEGGEHFT